MKIDLQTLCEKVEHAVPTARTTVVPEMHQVIVRFTNRPDVEVALLTPYLQHQVAKGHIDFEDYSNLILSICRIGESK